jgi:alpha-D-ribose 1-methylphosphonate 5-triphosphate synthase subunit PhnG
MEREHLNFYLQKADPVLLKSLCGRVEASQTVTLLQEPTLQTLLLPVADPVTRGSFYAGEILVTSAIVQIGSTKGWAMVMDEAPELAQRVAVLDAAYAADIEKEAIAALVENGRARYEQTTRELASQVETTRVSFDLL